MYLLFFGLSIWSSAALATFLQPNEKIVVETADQLPRYTYVLDKKPSELLLDEDASGKLRKQVLTDLKAQLLKYDIQDKATLRSLNLLASNLFLAEGDYESSWKSSLIAENLATKDSEKALTGLMVRSWVTALKENFDNLEGAKEKFISEYEKKVKSLNWEIVGKEIKSLAGRLRIISQDLILGQIQSSMDPMIPESLEVSHEIARSLVSACFTFEMVVPYKNEMLKALMSTIESNAEAKRPEIWNNRSVQFSGSEPYANVLISIWDSGIDANIFKDSLWLNPNENLDGTDTDENGFVDDIHGIGWDLQSNPTQDLLHSLKDLKSEQSVVFSHTKGLMDLQASIDSKESLGLQKYLSGLDAKDVGSFIEDLGLYGNYMHGTHVAGIAIKDNPFAKILPVRITFDYKSMPSICPSKELAEKSAKAFKKTVEYLQQAGVRVVNMSWGGSRSFIESALEKCQIGKTSEERAEMARKYFQIEKSSMEEVMQSADDILFVTSAGNSNNNVTFDEMVPSGLELPNLIVIGAVDHSGAPTSFTSFGLNVDVYANGFEIDSDVPGGKRLKASGTSMSSPQVTNLAAKILSIVPEMTPMELKKIIIDSSNRSYYDPKILLIHPKRAVALANNFRESKNAPTSIQDFSQEDQSLLKNMLKGLENIKEKEVLIALRSQLELQAKQEDVRQKHLAVFTIRAIDEQLSKIQSER